ncbi:hypothetical protein EDD27_3612 [Nonomuraea polychroma]|uniref:Uncharacterized protein n=1 Tax=Nonomuraea polychroma TaxID=46176 RepID=A0A438M5V8_9ACTN|nr:hypothetical protein [Nonomuraea polychroma]RVX41142.1 hypothetical protein EDD27_3612 [Nonomuraea polychroma]
MSPVEEMKAAFRARLDAAGVRELVQLDGQGEEERLLEWGRCPLCCVVPTPRFTIRLDENDHIHAAYDAICECRGP